MTAYSFCKAKDMTAYCFCKAKDMKSAYFGSVY